MEVIVSVKWIVRAKPASSPPSASVRSCVETAPIAPALTRWATIRRAYASLELVKARAQQRDERVAMVRIEQLYPFPFKSLGRTLQRYRNAEIVWCQEEPQNMGAWTFIEPRLRKMFGREMAYAGRDASASPAVGSLVRHKREQSCVVRDAFNV